MLFTLAGAISSNAIVLMQTDILYVFPAIYQSAAMYIIYNVYCFSE